MPISIYYDGPGMTKDAANILRLRESTVVRGRVNVGCNMSSVQWSITCDYHNRRWALLLPYHDRTQVLFACPLERFDKPTDDDLAHQIGFEIIPESARLLLPAEEAC